VPKSAVSALSTEKTKPAAKPVFLDMVNYTIEQEGRDSPHHSRLRINDGAWLYLSVFSILHCILRNMPISRLHFASLG
jgi:hypothetical protein